jgi:hypothetical protein
MINRLPLLIFLPLACIGCTEEPRPQPDPAKLEALVATLEAAGAEEAGKAERLINSVEKIPPERIDPKVALAVVGD